MNFLQIVCGGAIGTSVMTIFSYVISQVRGKQFREPELLNELLVRARVMKFTSSKNHPLGWIIHYGVGFAFVTLYQLLVHLTGIEPTLTYYLLAGLISGFIGVAAWHVTFSIHPNRPIIDFKEYYLQLIAAHVIFGLAAYSGITLGLS
jgi:hypothetical protein